MSVNRPQVHVLEMSDSDMGAYVRVEVEIQHKTYELFLEDDGSGERAKLSVEYADGKGRPLYDTEWEAARG